LTHKRKSVRAVLFLLGDVAKARNDNHERLPAAFAREGWQVVTADHESVAVIASELRIDGLDPEAADLIWPLGFGRQISFFDRMQLLRQLPQEKFVVSVDALVYLHGKHRWLARMPETHTSSNLDLLRDVLTSGGEWVLKPPAGSYGRDVIHVRNRSQALAALQQLSADYPGAYFMAQRYLPQAREGEKRTLVAGGSILGSYLKLAGGSHLANVSAGASVRESSLTATEEALVAAIARDLAAAGAGFAAIDTVYPYLMEVNVANPGGLATLAALGSPGIARETVLAIIRWKSAWLR
jgi:glutathione synthase/RimK-type ligase-like ATP-grasp enzyme